MERFYQLNDDCLINQRSSVESPHAGYKRLKKMASACTIEINLMSIYVLTSENLDIRYKDLPRLFKGVSMTSINWQKKTIDICIELDS